MKMMNNMQPQNSAPTQGGAAPQEGREQGRVTYFNDQQRSGCIVPLVVEVDKEDDQVVFVHYTDIVKAGYRSLNVDETVTYEIEINPETGKQYAKNVVVVGRGDVQPQQQDQNAGKKGLGKKGKKGFVMKGDGKGKGTIEVGKGKGTIMKGSGKKGDGKGKGKGGKGNLKGKGKGL